MELADVSTKEANRIMSFATDLCCLLLRTGSTVNSASNAACAVRTKYGAVKVSAFCLPDAIMLSAEFYGRQYTTLKRAYYGGNNLFIQEKCSLLVNDIVCGKVKPEEAENRLKKINSSGNVPIKFQVLGSLLACGAFAIFFGGNVADGIIAAVSGFITSYISAYLSTRGTGGCARVFLLSAVSGLMAVILCAISMLIGIKCHTSVVLVGTLMPLIPGLTVCNALSDIIGGELYSGIYRIFGGLSLTVCIVAGYAIALMASGGIYAFTVTSVQTDILHIIICYVSAASGAAGFCLAMNAQGKRLIYGIVAAVITYSAYLVAVLFGASEFLSYFIAAFTAYVAAQIPAKIIKIPSDLFVTPAVIPLLPGANMYFAVNAIVCGDVGTAVACGYDALIIFTAIAAGLAAAQLVARILSLNRCRPTDDFKRI